VTVLHGATNVCTLDHVVPDDEFVAMIGAANRFRTEVEELGMSGSDIDSNVRARLYWNPRIPDLPDGQEELADEIHALLDNPRLSAPQAAELERGYFPPRGHL
jgi:hypothetical protein